MHFACWISKATKMHSEYVLLSYGKKLLRKYGRVLRYTYFASIMDFQVIILQYFRKRER